MRRILPATVVACQAGAQRCAEPAYLDASTLVKLFVPEEDSDSLNHALTALTDVIVSDLALTETETAFVLNRRAREQRLILARLTLFVTYLVFLLAAVAVASLGVLYEQLGPATRP